MSYYRECPYCRAALDPGEKCTCRKESEQLVRKFELLTTVNKDGQIKFGGNYEYIKNQN